MIVILRGTWLPCPLTTLLFAGFSGPFRRHKHIETPPINAKTINMLQITISATHVSSSPKSFVSVWSKNKHLFYVPVLVNVWICLNSLIQLAVTLSSEPSEQWLTPSHNNSGLIQNSLALHLKSRQACFGSLTAVITSLKPFKSVPQLSVTYFNVIKLVLVKIAPTDCLVFRHDKSIFGSPTAWAPS